MLGTKGLIAYFIHIFMKFPILALILAIFVGTYVTVPQVEQTLDSQCNLRINQLEYAMNVIQEAYQPYENGIIEWAKESRVRIVEHGMRDYQFAKAWLKHQSVPIVVLAEKASPPKAEKQDKLQTYYPIQNRIIGEEVDSNKKGGMAVAEDPVPERGTPLEREEVAQADTPATERSVEMASTYKKEGLAIVQASFSANDYAMKKTDSFEKGEWRAAQADHPKNEYIFPTVQQQGTGEVEAGNQSGNMKTVSDEKEKVEVAIQLQQLLVKKPMTKKEKEKEAVAVQLAQFLAKKYMTAKEKEDVAEQLRQLLAKKHLKSDSDNQYTNARW